MKASSIIFSAMFPALPALAQEPAVEGLVRRVESLERQVAELKAELAVTKVKAKSPEKSIIGSWQTPGMQTLTFYEDGIMTIVDQGHDFPGRFTIQPGNKILIETKAGKNIITYSFKDANTLLMSSGKNDGSMDEMRRITHQGSAEKTKAP